MIAHIYVSLLSLGDGVDSSQSFGVVRKTKCLDVVTVISVKGSLGAKPYEACGVFVYHIDKHVAESVRSCERFYIPGLQRKVIYNHDEQ